VHANEAYTQPARCARRSATLFVRLAPVIDWQVHDESGFCIRPDVHAQADFPGDRHHAGITRLLHGLPPHRVDPGIQPEGGRLLVTDGSRWMIGA